MTTFKSANVTNLDADPVVAPDVSQLGGRIRIAIGTMELTTADLDSADIIILDRFPSNSVPIAITIWNDDVDSGNAVVVDCGIYTTSGTAKDSNAFATLLTTLQAAVVTAAGTEILGEAGAAATALIGQKLWEWAGDATDPGGLLDIALTVTTAAGTAVAGTLSYRIYYSID